MLNTVGNLLVKRALLNPGFEAAVDTDTHRRLTYAEFNKRVNQVAHMLLSQGVGKGDRIALLMRNRLEFMESFFASAKAGAVAVPLNSRLLSGELEYSLTDAGASVLIFDAEFDKTIADLQHKQTNVKTWLRVGDAMPSPPFTQSYEHLVSAAVASEPDITISEEDLLLILYTSGTTGSPKGVMHTHNSMIWASLTWILSLDIRPGDRFLLFMPPFHVGVLLPLTMVSQRGGSMVLMHQFEPVRVLQLIDDERINATLATPTMLHTILGQPELEGVDFSTLRWCIVGAGPVPGWLIKRFKALGVAMLQDYGLTESGGPATVITPAQAAVKPDSAGTACFYSNVRVIDSQGNDVPAGELGEILVQGRHNMIGYWNRPQATAETIRDGWLYTGDIGKLDEDGCVYICDRKKDMIVSGGENIYPLEIEHLLLTHPKIKDVSVIAQPSPKWGESALAIIVLHADQAIALEEMIDFCRDKIAGYKIPRLMEIVDHIPRTNTGKIQKRLLKVMFPGPAPV